MVNKFSEIAIHAQGLKGIGKFIFNSPPINRVSAIASKRLFVNMPVIVDVVNRQKIVFAFATTRTLEAVMFKNLQFIALIDLFFSKRFFSFENGVFEAFLIVFSPICFHSPLVFFEPLSFIKRSFHSRSISQ